MDVPWGAPDLCCSTVLLPSLQHCAPSIPHCLQTDSLRFGRNLPWKVSGIVVHRGTAKDPYSQLGWDRQPKPKAKPLGGTNIPQPTAGPTFRADPQYQCPYSGPISSIRSTYHYQCPLPTPHAHCQHKYPSPSNQDHCGINAQCLPPHSQC